MEFKTTVSSSFFQAFCPDPTSIYDLGELYAEFNAKYFDGNLRVLRVIEKTDANGDQRNVYPELKWEGRFRKLWGYYKPGNQRGTGMIKIARKAALDPIQVRSTLLHEMVHKWLDQVGKDDGIKGHGQNFIDKARQINEICDRTGVKYRVNFYDVPVTKEEPEAFSDMLKTKIYCGKDLDLARKMKSILNAAFETYEYDQ